MKRLLIINGSPDTKGHTTKIIDAITKGIKEDIEINYVNCYSLNINPCIDCKYCGKVIGECSIKDSMTEIYMEIKGSHIIILASPMYFGMFPAPLKALIDRCQVMWSEKHIFNKNMQKNKQGIFLFNGGASWNNMFASMETIGKYFFNTIDCNINYKLYIDNTDISEEYLTINNDKILECQSLINEFKY